MNASRPATANNETTVGNSSVSSRINREQIAAAREKVQKITKQARERRLRGYVQPRSKWSKPE